MAVTVTELARLVTRLSLLYPILPLICLQQTSGSESMLTNGCVCPSDILTYECTTMGAGSTTWTGSAFNGLECKEIVLLHSRFLNGGTNGSCGNGSVLGRSVSVDGNNYTSQLHITVTSETAGKTVECNSDNGTSSILISSFMIPTTATLSPPKELNFSKNYYSSRELTFSWSPAAPDCPAIHYNILASNCGSCPTTTNHTNVTCTDVPTNGSVCIFAVQTVVHVCGNITGTVGDPIRIIFYDTKPTGTATESPYVTENQGIHKLNITVMAYIASITSLATALIISIVILITVVVTIMKRSKAKMKAAFESSNRVEGNPHMEFIHKEISSPVSAIDTCDNLAYSLTKSSTSTM